MATTTHGTREIPIEKRDEILGWNIDKESPMMCHKNKKGDIESTWFIAILRGTGNYNVIRYIDTPGMKVRKFISIVMKTKTKSAEERVLGHVVSKMTKLYRKGWCFSLEEAMAIKETDVCNPMLYHTYESFSSKLNYPIIGQPKYDGYRCIWNPDEGKLVTRGGKTFDLPHISDTLKAVAWRYWLDGEICFEVPQPLGYVNEQISKKNEDLKFMVWDVGMDTELSYKDRLAALLRYQKALEESGIVKVVPSFVINDHHEVYSRWEQWTSEGYEGIMLKNLDAPYKWGIRVTDHLKYKFTFEVNSSIESITSDVIDKGPMISFNCKAATGIQKITPAWTHEQRLWMYEELHRFGAFFTGIPVTIEHRGVTKDGKYIHAVIVSPYDSVYPLATRLSGKSKE